MSRLLACAPGMPKSLLGGLSGVLEAAAGVGDPVAERVPDADEAGVVFSLREQGERTPSKRFELVDVGILRDHKPLVGGDDAGERFTSFVACLAGSLSRSFRDRQRLLG